MYGWFLRILALVVLWTFGLITCDKEKDLNTCSFYYWRVDWQTAVKTCQHEDKQLLCYKSKREIDDITEAFRLAAFGTASLELWLSRRNCSYGPMEKCLSLHIQKSGKTFWHFYQSECGENFPFVCCVNGSMQTSSDFDYTTKPMNLTSDHFEITDSSLLTTTYQSSTGRTHFCPNVRRRGIFWPDTEIGEEAVLPCPGNSTGEARWACENSTGRQWKPDGPDMSKCRSLQIQNLKDMFNSSSASYVISELGSIFKEDETDIFADDLADVMSMMSLLPDRLFRELESLTPSEKWRSTSQNVEKVVSVISNVVELNAAWSDINVTERSAVGTNLLSTVDGMGGLLAESMPEEEVELHFSRENIALQVLKPKSGEPVILPHSLTRHEGHITLGKGFHDPLKDRNVSVVFALYKDMSNVLPPAPTHEIPPVLNSAVLSVTVIQGRSPRSVDSLTHIVVEHLTQDPNNSACVFWNIERNSWDTDGCWLEGANQTHSVCICNHLTNFALLMDYQDVLSDLNQLPFHYVTLIGCYLSIMCLGICIVVFSCYSYHSRHSWGLRYVIHRNLCICLLVANIVLVAGLDSTSNQRLCALVAGLLHYFFLAAFSWMFLEAVHIYLLLVVVFASRRSHSEKYYIFGYGFPLIIVAITAISRPMYYGTDQLCWLSPEKGTIWAFMGPVACILTLNVAALVLAQYKASKVSAKDDKAALAKRWLRVTIILFPILGITWVFGFLYLGKYFEIVGYLFAIFNSFQGVCIFVFHCLLDKKARNMIMDSFKKSSSIHTGSSGTQKKLKEHGQNGENSITPVDIDDSRKVKSIKRAFQKTDTHKRDWSKWRRPWSFCFEMPVSEKEYEQKVRKDRTPVAVITNWNSLKDKNCL